MSASAPGVDPKRTDSMYIVVVGGGKVGSNVARALLRMGHEVSIVEIRSTRYQALEAEFEHRAIRGDGTEIYVLEAAGMGRAQWCIAATGDDEDNIIIAQVARERFGVEQVVARVNDPRNQEHFDLLGIAPTVCATTSILSLVEHEVPHHTLVKLLTLRKEGLEMIEMEIGGHSPAAGTRIRDIDLPRASLIVSVLRDGEAFVPRGASHLEAGDQVLVITEPGHDDELVAMLGAVTSSEVAEEA